MNTIDTISDLLSLSQSQFRIYDLGRVISKISKQDFEKIELNQIPYPFPSQNHAFMAIVFWQKNTTEPFLWFVKLPLDERGLLNQGARNHFIAIIIEALALQKNNPDLSITPSAQQEEKLKNNPYHFTPAQYKLASLNSMIKVELKQPPSQYYQQAQRYFSGQEAWSSWQNIAIQGITDVVARLTTDNNAEILATNFKHLPEEVLLPLCGALENQCLPIELLSSVITAIKTHKNNSILQQHLLRALATTATHPHVQTVITELLHDKQLDDDIFIVIATRCWQALNNEQLVMLFLEKLAHYQDEVLFSSLFKDLIAIPTIRPLLFSCMRQPSRSDVLAKAIGQLFNQVNA